MCSCVRWNSPSPVHTSRDVQIMFTPAILSPQASIESVIAQVEAVPGRYQGSYCSQLASATSSCHFGCISSKTLAPSAAKCF